MVTPGRSPGGIVREHIARHAVVREGTAAHAKADFICFAAHEGSVDSFEERTHRVVLWHKQEIDGAVGTRDVAVEGYAETEDDPAHGGILDLLGGEKEERGDGTGYVDFRRSRAMMVRWISEVPS
jgi:hypothetical protein